MVKLAAFLVLTLSFILYPFVLGYARLFAEKLCFSVTFGHFFSRLCRRIVHNGNALMRAFGTAANQGLIL